MFNRYLLFSIIALTTVFGSSFSCGKKENEPSVAKAMEDRVKDYAGWEEKSAEQVEIDGQDQDLTKYMKYVGRLPVELQEEILQDPHDYCKYIRNCVLRYQHLLWPAVTIMYKEQKTKARRIIDYINGQITRIKEGPVYALDPKQKTCIRSCIAICGKYAKFSIRRIDIRSGVIPNFVDLIKAYPEFKETNNIFIATYSDNAFSIHINDSLLTKLANNYTYDQLKFIARLASVERDYRLNENEWRIFTQLDDETKENLQHNYPYVHFDLPRGLRSKAEFGRDDFFARF